MLCSAAKKIQEDSDGWWATSVGYSWHNPLSAGWRSWQVASGDEKGVGSRITCSHQSFWKETPKTKPLGKEPWAGAGRKLNSDHDLLCTAVVWGHAQKVSVWKCT